MIQKPTSPAVLTSMPSLNCFDFQREWGYSNVYSLLKTFPVVLSKYQYIPSSEDWGE